MVRKGQLISLIIIVTLLVFISFSFLIYIRYRTTAINAGGKTRQVLIEKELADVVAKQIDGCLRMSAVECLYLAGLQAGKIYQTQSPGTAPLIWPPAGLYVIPFETENVSFGIAAPRREIPPPEYPFPGSLRSAEGFFGRNVLTPLCDNQGVNAWDREDVSRSCISYDSVDSRHSVQEYLQSFVLNRTLQCINLADLYETYGTNLSLGEGSVSIFMGDTDVRATLNLEIIINTGGIVQQMLTNISVLLPVRLKKIYELAYYIVEADTSDPYFNINDNNSIGLLKNCPTPDRQSFNQVCLKPLMEVSVKEDVCMDTCTFSRYANIVRIRDNGSIVAGMPYVFQFAMENRRPALELIDESGSSNYNAYLLRTYGRSMEDIYLKTANSPYKERYNIAVTEGSAVEILPLGLDPDSDTIVYSYSGWKTPHIIPEQYPDPFGKSSVLNHGGDSGDNEWESSAYYNINKKDAVYTTNPTNHEDAGYHVVRVNVSDSEGKSDWQDVEILVNDRPVFSLTVTGNCGSYNFDIGCSDDIYYSNYTLKIYDDFPGNVYLEKSSSLCDFHVGQGADIGGIPPTTLRIRVTDDFGAYDEKEISVCK